MSSEVCPFCGKTYKRLKSHLPHCKAATSSKTPPAKHEAKVTQTSSSRLATALTKPTVTASPQSKKSTTVSVLSTTTPLQSEHASSSSQSQSTATPPPSTKKKKQKLSEQIKTSTATISVLSTQSQPPSLSATISKPKKKSLRASMEAAKSNEVSKGTLEEVTSTSGDLPSALTQFFADPLSSGTTAQTETSPDKDPVKDGTHHAFLSTDTIPKGASRTSVSKTKAAARDLPTAKDTSSSLDSGLNKSSAKPHVGDEFWEGSEEDLSVNQMFLKSRGGHQARITLSDVKATLGRANATRRPSILSQTVTTNDDLSSKVRPGSRPSPIPVPTRNQDTSPTPPLPSATLLSQVGEVRSPPQTVGMKVGHHLTGLPTMSPSLTRISRHHLFPHEPRTVRVEILRAEDGLTMETSQLGVRKQNTSHNGPKGQHWTVKSAAVTQQGLGQVRLKELPEWLACKAPRRPSDAVKMVQRGWQWYYKRYIDVRKGGVGGLSMLLAGYCVLSYIWSYPRIKHDRWRKYH